MPSTQPFAAGGYRFLPFQFQYSGGVVAEPGFRIERARFHRPLPLAQGFDAVEAYLGSLGPPPAAARPAANRAAAIPTASSASATSRPMRCARRRALYWARWSGAWPRSA